MDDSTLAAWLQAREAVDHRSRSAELVVRIAAVLPTDRPISILDLGAGTGSNLRYLARRLPPRQRWLFVDRSRTLLEAAAARTEAWARACGCLVLPHASGFSIAGDTLDCRVDLEPLDLGRLDVPEIIEGCDLVTASALLDLVSETWLRTLAGYCCRFGAAVLFALTYDGRSSCTPPDPHDEMIRGRMNQHQRRDKGLGGPAAGGDGAAVAACCFETEGYEVATAASEWRLGPPDLEVQRTLVNGWAEAALEVAPWDAAATAGWQARRLAHIDACRSYVTVGHVDVAAWKRR